MTEGLDLELSWSIHNLSSCSWEGPKRKITSHPRVAELLVDAFESSPRLRSVRKFSNRPVESTKLEQILKHSYGGTGGVRPIPSAGAIYQLRIFVARKLTSELFEFHGDGLPRDSSKVSSVEIDESVFYQFQGAYDLVMIFGAAKPYVAKYGTRGYRFMLLEAGHLGQEILRGVKDSDLCSCPVGAFCDDSWVNLVGGGFINIMPLYGIAIGNSA